MRTSSAQRRAIDQLLPQLGLPQLDKDLPPLDGVRRLIAAGGDARQMSALKDCERWLWKHQVEFSRSTGEAVSALPQPDETERESIDERILRLIGWSPPNPSAGLKASIASAAIHNLQSDNIRLWARLTIVWLCAKSLILMVPRGGIEPPTP